MNKKILFTALCCCALTLQSALAKDYYVSIQSGSDAHPGTKELPFMSISKASSVMQAGDRCIIREGIYRETITPLVSGTARKPIIYTTYKDEKVTISALESLSQWTKYKNDIYKAPCQFPADIDVDMHALYSKGTVMDIARWPNNLDHDPFTLDAEFIEKGSDSTKMKCASIPPMNWEGGYMTYMGAHSGTAWTKPIVSTSPGYVHYQPVSFAKWPFANHNPNRREGSNRQGQKQIGQIILFGVLDALDYPGEWYYDAKAHEVYLMARDKEQPADGQVEYTAREFAIHTNGKSHIQFSNLDIFGGRVFLQGDYNRISQCHISNACQRFDDIDNTNASIEDAAITVRGQHVEIEKNILEHGAGDGILSYRSHHLLIRDNIIRYFNTAGVHCCGIRTRGSDYVKVLHNTVHSSGRDLITVMGRHCETAYNDMYQAGLLNNDGGCYYVTGNTEYVQNTVHHNWVHDCEGPWYASHHLTGIYLDNNTKGYEVYNNVVWNMPWPGIYMNLDNWGIKIYHNTVFNCSHFMGRWEFHRCLKDVVVKNNLSDKPIDEPGREPTKWDNMDYNTTTNKNIVDMHPMNACLVDAPRYGFMPRAHSRVVDAGVHIEGFTKKYKGKAPDVGAYEYGQKPWTAGITWDEKDFRK